MLKWLPLLTYVLHIYVVLISAVLHICSIYVEMAAASCIHVTYMQFSPVQFCIYVIYVAIAAGSYIYVTHMYIYMLHICKVVEYMSHVHVCDIYVDLVRGIKCMANPLIRYLIPPLTCVKGGVKVKITFALLFVKDQM